MQTLLILFLPLFPLLCGGLCWFLPCLNNDKRRRVFVTAALAVNLAAALGLYRYEGGLVYLFSITDALPLFLKNDGIGRLFALLAGAMWLNTGCFSFGYMAGDKAQRRFYTFYLLTLGAINGVCLAGTLVCLYLNFEMMTLLSLALVLHSLSKEAVAAGIKYLIYSIAGAMMGLFGIFFFTQASVSPIFVPGGTLSAAAAQNAPTLLWVLLITVIGFSTKAGMFPMHGWLPTAHPIAPAPASAVLSGVITKMGVLCVIRVIYYTVGANFLRGTWVQTVLLSLSLATVFMGSMMALKTTGLKKRLAYSTVSQVSYILFGLFILNGTAFTGALLHLYFHSVMKNALFLCAGAIIVQTGFTDVSQLTGIGKRMPLTLWCFTLAGLGLVGIPPLCGFFSKWELATGAVLSGTAVFSWLGPVVLLVSALLTAAYLLPVSVNAFFPGRAQNEAPELGDGCEVKAGMAVPLVILAALTVVMGLWPNLLTQAAAAIAADLL